MNAWTSVNEEKKVTGVIVVKLNIGSIPSEDIPGYVEAASSRLTNETLRAQGYMFYVIPVRDEGTSMTFIDLATMRSARA